MRNLVLILVKYGGIILFLSLELICMYLIVNYNQAQKEIWANSSNLISAQVLETREFFSQYYRLASRADSLAAENARLKAQLRNAKFISTILRDSTVDEKFEQKYTFIHAKVINSSIHTHNNSLTLDRGSHQGIQPHMGVIGAGPNGGIVGIVRNTSGNHCQVMSILHRQSRISTGIRRNNYHGFLSWQPGNPKQIQLTDVPKHADVLIGDTLETTEYSNIFPQGIAVAIVDTFWQEPGSNFHSINATLINDMSNVKYVHIVNNLMKEEFEELRKEGEDE
ncbi:MAG: rod shape-determining protein MreC [Bacteroidota bacterium]